MTGKLEQLWPLDVTAVMGGLKQRIIDSGT
jgi:hypothetical protein